MKKIMFNDKFGLTQAVLEGRKTMTRRIIKAPETWHGFDVYGFSVNRDNLGNVMDISLVGADGGSIEDENGSIGMILPKYNDGEVVAVAQSYKDAGVSPYFIAEEFEPQVQFTPGWNNKMFVKAWPLPNRIRITDMKIERLQDISDEDCLKEGISSTNAFEIGYGIDVSYYFQGENEAYYTPREAFAALIDKVSGKGTWERNHYVFVYSFELVK